ncbi:MAG: DUF2075 domain-containing protein [Candidatus Pseudobacter hemicellulosilyticus]|uniref:DUF2075 domain-containing protein n=1 Tax=Candidatus Pseudobacter hemicellulosilyticus TaxID=3121375 RepID=A0AAJ5WT35_9BACT|nr:MAG: DUF2075 domain-containing protein [Pseudobacter sp.]
MTRARSFKIKEYALDKALVNNLYNDYYTKDLWPVVYILSCTQKMEAYVGETTDLFARMDAHLRDERKNLPTLHIISGSNFNKSVTLNIEANLIRYMAGDKQYKLLNANLGLANHNFYGKEKYEHQFFEIWKGLKDKKIVKNSLNFIGNLDVFKYSPYKSLSPDQRYSLLCIMKSLISEEVKTTVIEGGAGTGKSVLAVFLFKLLKTNIEDISLNDFGESEAEFIKTVYALKERYPEPKMALVVPVSSFRDTLQKVFGQVEGLEGTMVVGPTDITKDEFDIVVVDEAHRLHQIKGIGTSHRTFSDGCRRLDLDPEIHTELDWMLKQSERRLLFYDKNQSIRLSDVADKCFEDLQQLSSTNTLQLKSQLRCKGGTDYVKYVHDLMNNSFRHNRKLFRAKKYSFLLFDSLKDMIDQIKLRDKEKGLARLVAGYSWRWVSRKNPKLFDIEIEGIFLRWNSATKNWINSPNAINEVGCIHTSQGYDLNYCGVIFGHEISYDEEKDEIIILKKNYADRNGKAGVFDPARLKRYIINIYMTLLQRGIDGTYIYVCDEKLKKYLKKHIPVSNTNRRKENYNKPVVKFAPNKNAVPFYDLTITAGQLIPQKREKVDWLILPEGERKPGKDTFACKVIGEPTNKKIPHGSICLFKWKPDGKEFNTPTTYIKTLYLDGDGEIIKSTE